MNNKEEIQYQETNGIPICPYCQKPTKRTGGQGYSTSMYFPPEYDETGKNINPDRNIFTQDWHCNNCGKTYQIAGNYIDSFKYTLFE